MTNERVWVADTSSILHVRRCVNPPDARLVHAERKRVFQRLTQLVEQGRLIFPTETFNELKEGNKKLKDPGADHPFAFVDGCKDKAMCEARLDIVQELVSHDLVRRVVDPDAEGDEADIYVLAVAVELQREGREVGVLTQERNDHPRKLSVNTACGVLQLVCLPMQALLHQEDIWKWTFTS